MVLETHPGFFIGPLFIYYYGIVYALTALVLYAVLMLKKKKLNLNDSQVDTFIISALVGLLIGGRLVHFLINNPAIFFTDPLQLLMIRQGGMSFFGSAIGIMLSTWIWYKMNSKSSLKSQKSEKSNSVTPKKVNTDTFLHILDYGSVVVSFALIFGRLANFLNQELVGRVTDPKVITWCVEFATTIGCRHPYQLYAAASHVILAVIVLTVIMRARKAGVALATFFITYGALRFITDFWRDDAIFGFGLTVWQFFAIAITIIGIFFLQKVNRLNTIDHKD